MTTNPDSALRQALVAAEKAIQPFARSADEALPAIIADATDYVHEQRMVMISLPGEGESEPRYSGFSVGDLRHAREAHALIIEALQRGEK